MTDEQLHQMLPGAHWARTRTRIREEMKDGMSFVNAHKVAEHFGINEQTVRRMARTGKIPSIKVGHVHRFNLAACAAYFAAHGAPMSDAEKVADACAGR